MVAITGQQRDKDGNVAKEESRVKPTRRDAILVIPGLLHKPGEALRASSEKIVAALDRQARTGKARFLLKEGKEEKYQGNTTPALTIIRTADDEFGEIPLIDMYEASYEYTLTGRFKNRKPLIQALSISWSIFLTIPRLFTAIGKPSKGPLEKARILTAGFVLMLLIAYMVILLVTAAGTVADLLTPNLPAPLKSALINLQGLLVVSTAAGLLSRTTLKEIISRSAIWFTSAVSYLNMGDRRSTLTGQISSLLEHISEKELEEGEEGYRTVHMIAYSFGSIVAIDVLFPDDEAPGQRNLDIDTFVTIASPFDFIRTFWGRYFKNRYMLPRGPRKWINIYMPADVLSSDFMDRASTLAKGASKLRSALPGSRKSATSSSDTEQDAEPNGDEGRRRSKTLKQAPAYIGIMDITEKEGNFSSEKEPAGIEVKIIQGTPSRREYKQRVVYPRDNIRFAENIEASTSFIERYFLLGLKLHARYWGAEEPYARSCFDIIVQRIYEGDFALR